MRRYHLLFASVLAVLAALCLAPAPAAAFDVCGNGICKSTANPPETCSNCPQDCGQCPSDSDGDGVSDPYDNCVNTYNPSQADCDGDGTGDVCDAENANYQLNSSSISTCYIQGQEGAVVTRYKEARYEDQSSCNAPDDWRLYQTTGRACFGWEIYPCCTQHFGTSDCNNYLNRNQCQY